MSSLFSSLMGGKVKQSAGAQLLERMSTATQLEDKREALSEFKVKRQCDSDRLGSGPARLCCLFRARLVALVGSTHSQGVAQPLAARARWSLT